MSAPMSFQSWYATAPRGAESALAGELAALGCKGIRERPGMVRFTGTRETALRVCLDSRCVLRVLEPLGEFSCSNAEELYAGARALPCNDVLSPDQTFAISATGRAPTLENTQFIALKVKDALCDALRDARGSRPDVDTENPGVRIAVHVGDGRCSVSLDLAGALLSDRGYRVRTVEAPLREALAAAVIRLSGWDLERPLADPLCGSGTLAIEAAGMALQLAPNELRPLSCELWPRTMSHDGPALARLRTELSERARARRESPPPQIRASDRDRGAVAAAQANVRAAGLEGIVRVGEQDARLQRPLEPPGFILCNVPYGERLEVGGKKQLKSFYHALGDAFRALPGHEIAILSASEEFESAFGLRPRGRPLELWNGPLRCQLYRYSIPPRAQ